MDAQLKNLPPERESLEAILRSLILERDEQRLRAEQQTKRADELVSGELLRGSRFYQ